jgi:hypothetical protein
MTFPTLSYHIPTNELPQSCLIPTTELLHPH